MQGLHAVPTSLALRSRLCLYSMFGSALDIEVETKILGINRCEESILLSKDKHREGWGPI